MGKLRTYPPVKIFVAVTYAQQISPEEVFAGLEHLLSPVDSRSGIFAFSEFTDYYFPEMGAELKKQVIAFRDLLPAENLPDIKISTNILETRFPGKNGRRVNIDPGYICAAKVVLATTKDYDHRLYLGRGIFGDVHLRFRGGHFGPNDWTYPDYRQPEIIRFFEELRGAYMNQLKDYPVG
jgi:hypothetical protein